MESHEVADIANYMPTYVRRDRRGFLPASPILLTPAVVPVAVRMGYMAKTTKRTLRAPKGEKILASKKMGRSWAAKAAGKEDTPAAPGTREEWQAEVAERVAKRMALEAGMTDAEYAEHRKGKCVHLTSGKYGPQRPCDQRAMKGTTVCQMHGGMAKQTKEAARKRIMEEVFPTIDRLTEIRDQNGHMPSALGASKELLNRAMGKPEATQGQLGAGAPIILIGERLGGLPIQIIEANRQKRLAEASGKDDDDVFEGQVVPDKQDDDDIDPFDE